MEKCIYNGKILYAYQVLQNYEFEQEIRKCPTLTCCDCGASVFFRHGKQRTECFVHRRREECRYGEYCKKQSNIFKFIQREFATPLHQIADTHGWQLEEDVVIIRDHYTAFVLRSPEISYAIDIIDYAATASSLEKRKALYEQQGYRFLQIIVDKHIEREPFSERDTAYFPVKFALNTTFNNTAIVIDEDQKSWCIYILDKTDLSKGIYGYPAWLNINTLAVSITLEDIDLDNRGFFTTASSRAFADFCATRKSNYENTLKAEKEKIERWHNQQEEALKRIEQQHLERERQIRAAEIKRQKETETRKKAEEGFRRIEQQRQTKELRLKEEMLKKQQESDAKKRKRDKDDWDEVVSIHQATNGFVSDKKIKGKYKISSIDEITANNPPQNLMCEYTRQNFEDNIHEIQQYRAFGVKKLFNKMCNISAEEMTMLLEVYRELQSTDEETSHVIETMMQKAGILYR